MLRSFCASALIFSLTACASASGPAADAAPRALGGSEWMLRDVGGTPALAGGDASLAFLDGERANGSGSCNRFTATYTLGADGSLRFGPIATTRRACPGPIGEQEARYLRALESAERVALQGGELLIYSRGAPQPLRFARKAG